VTAVSRAVYLKYKKHKGENSETNNVEVTVTNAIIFDNERKMSEGNAKSYKNINVFNDVNMGNDNPTYVNDKDDGFLNVPQFDKFRNNKLSGHIRSPGSSSVDVRTPLSNFSRNRIYSSSKLCRIKSTSYRSMGSFAKIIISMLMFYFMSCSILNKSI